MMNNLLLVKNQLKYLNLIKYKINNDDLVKYLVKDENVLNELLSNDIIYITYNVNSNILEIDSYDTHYYHNMPLMHQHNVEVVIDKNNEDKIGEVLSKYLMKMCETQAIKELKQLEYEKMKKYLNEKLNIE